MRTITISNKNSGILNYLLKSLDMNEIVIILFKRDFSLQYRKSKIGWMWPILYPLIYGIIFYELFKSRHSSIDSIYFESLICGLIPWMMISQMVTQSSTLFSNYGNIIQKVYFPKVLLVLAQFLNRFLDFGIGITLLVVFMIIKLNFFNIHVIPLLLGILLLIIYTLGLGLWSSFLGFKSKDYKLGIGFFMQIVMFFSGIFNQNKLMIERKSFLDYLIFYNPISVIIQFFRNGFGLVDNEKIENQLFTFLIGFLVLISGILIIYNFDKKIAENI